MSAVPRTAASRRTGVGTRLAPWASQIGIITAFLLLWIAFVVLAPRTFLDTPIYLSFAQTTPYFAIIAMSLTMVIVAGDIDLSFPATMSLGMVGFVALWQATGNVGLGVVGALGVGVLCGLFNGFFVTFIGIPALVVTIGTQFLFRGLALVLVGGRQYPLVETQDSLAYQVMVGKLFGVPMEFYWFLLATVGTWVLLNRHRLGQNAYVTGDNAQAAALMGIPIRRTRIILFVLVGVAAAFAGRPQQPPGRQLLPIDGRRVSAAGPGRGLRRRDVRVRRSWQRAGHGPRRVHDRRASRPASSPSA